MSGPAFKAGTLPKDETPDYPGPCTRVPAFTYVGSGLQAGPYRRTRLQITQDHVRGSRLSRMSGPACKAGPYRRTTLQITQDHVRGSRLSRMSGPGLQSRTLPKDDTPK